MNKNDLSKAKEYVKTVQNKSSHQIGSSETTREMLLTQPKNNTISLEDYTRFGTPLHKPITDPIFLEWFIGFFEAEGSFLKWPDNKMRDRFGIDVSQKDAQLIQKIRSQLGFGKITEVVKSDGKVYWRYYVQTLENLTRLIWLFNGNLVTDKKQEQFRVWLDCINKRYDKDFVFHARRPDVSFKNGWLSGFLEGDGGFYISSSNVIRLNKNNSRSYNVKMKFYITQKGEEHLFSRIKSLFKIPTNVYQIVNGHTLEKYNRIETNRLDCHSILNDYLTRYPFLGQRCIMFQQWKRVFNYRTKDYPITDKSILKLKRLIASVKKGKTSKDIF